jgi:heterodisulfide reductase subunit A-like polyferredoxin
VAATSAASTAAKKILLVGGGLSSAATFHYLSKMLKISGVEAKFQLWESNPYLGGRMAHFNISGASAPDQLESTYFVITNYIQ